MDLRKFGVNNDIKNDLMQHWWYQPYIFDDDIISGIAPTWFNKKISGTIFKRTDESKYFKTCWDLNNRAIHMYEDW
ncbi:MAG: hypothetical protein ACYDHW_08695, partial [Syntrophorhabdaceae bacterium]